MAVELEADLGIENLSPVARAKVISDKERFERLSPIRRAALTLGVPMSDALGIMARFPSLSDIRVLVGKEEPMTPIRSMPSPI